MFRNKSKEQSNKLKILHNTLLHTTIGELFEVMLSFFIQLY